MKNLACVLLVAVLAGCATTRDPVPTVVQVPVVARCEKPDMPQRPALAISQLTTTSLADEVQRAYVQTVEALKGYAASLEPLVGKCKNNNTNTGATQ